jgi:hypothetical protein
MHSALWANYAISKHRSQCKAVGEITLITQHFIGSCLNATFSWSSDTLDEYSPLRFRRGSVRLRYSSRVDLGHKFTLEGSEGKYTSNIFPCLDVLWRSEMTNLMAFGKNTLWFKSNKHKVCSLWAQTREHNMAVLRVWFFRLSSFKGHKKD